MRKSKRRIAGRALQTHGGVRAAQPGETFLKSEYFTELTNTFLQHVCGDYSQRLIISGGMFFAVFAKILKKSRDIEG
jgi:hypothetical protein